jgi:hypothetical protein
VAGFVLGVEQSDGDLAILGLEAFETFGLVIEGVVDAATTEEQSVTRFHTMSPIVKGRDSRR